MASESQNRTKADYDIAVVGAGLQGASIALAAVARGLRTLVIHAGVVGGSASSRQSVLVGGGFEELTRLHLDDFLCNSRELATLRRRAAHLVKPLDAVFLDTGGLSSRAKIALASRVYKQFCPADSSASDRSDPSVPTASKQSPKQINDPFFAAFGEACRARTSLPAYTVNYARLGIATLQQLARDKASLKLRHQLISAQRSAHVWDLHISDTVTGDKSVQCAKIVINCAGARIDTLIHEAFEIRTRGTASCGYTAQLFLRYPQNWQAAAIVPTSTNPGAAKRLLTLHPLSSKLLCLGQIYSEQNTADSKAQAIQNALDQVNHYLQVPVNSDDIAHCQWSEQAFIEDPISGRACEDILLDLNNPGNAAPLLNVFGSKPCQHRKIAQQALDVLHDLSDQKSVCDTQSLILPGGDFQRESPFIFTKNLALRYPFLEFSAIERYVQQFGTHTHDLLSRVENLADMGQHFGHGLYAREVDYLRKNEWALSVEDILWRRTLLGLMFDVAEVENLRRYIGQ